MKRGLRSIVLTLWVFCQFQAANGQRAEVVDGVAAIVNGDVITISQLRELVAARERSLRQVYRGEELRRRIAELRLSTLKDLIDRQLILQEFKVLQERGAKIPEYVIDDRIRQVIREEFGGDRSAFVRTLRAQGFSISRFREMEREKLIVQAMRQSKAGENFVISPNQIQKFYNENRAMFTIPEQVKLRMIVVRGEDDGDVPDGSDRRQLAEEIRMKIVEGASFERLAQMYSDDDSTRDVGGDWGWIEKGTLMPELSRVAFSLKAGEVSQVVELGGSFYILMVDARKNAQLKPISDVREEIEKNLIQEERKKAQERWLDTLRQKSFIKIMT